MNPSDRETQLLEEAQTKGPLGKAAIYTKLSGPGWLQGAITLGGGSLAGALYIGIIGGYQLMWLQPFAMVLGVIMLSAIGYVALSTGERPFASLNRSVSPALGWSWLIATVMANIVWAMPQFSLGIGAVQQNLFPSLGTGTTSTLLIGLVFLVLSFVVNMAYEKGSKGVALFENILKAMVGMIVISFFLVVAVLSFKGGLDWGAIIKGALPRVSDLFNPAPRYAETIAASGAFADFWRDNIINIQRDRIITAFGTSVGINMTFLLPYSMLRRGWGRKHRGLAIFDLSLGLVIPFVLATNCIVIAAVASFHAKNADILQPDGMPFPKAANAYYASFKNHPAVKDALTGLPAGATADQKTAGLRETVNALPDPDRQLGAMLAERSNTQLASTLSPLTGPAIAQKVFGFGVMGMALSTIIVLMLMNGFAFQELFHRPGNRTVHLAGCLVSGIGGFVGTFIWSNPDTRAALAVPTSIIGGSMIPIAYFSFLLMMNSRKLLGADRPSGGRRILWNTLMMISTVVASAGSIWVLRGKGLPGQLGIIFLTLLFVVGVFSFLRNERRA